MITAPDLVASCGTLRRASFPDRVAAAAQAGFRGIGLTTTEYRNLHAYGWTDAQMRKVLERFGISLVEAEFIVGFWLEPGPANLPERPGLVYADPESERALFRMADEFGVNVMQAVGTFDSRPLGSEVAEGFGALCDRAAPHGLTVALEFVPYTSIPTLESAQKVVVDAGRANGGLCFDTWHFFRGGGAVEQLALIDSATVKMVQVNDGPAIPTDPNRMVDAVSNRLCPGEGDFPLADCLRELWSVGVDVPLSVEVFSLDLERLPSRAIAERAASGTRAVMAGAGIA